MDLFQLLVKIFKIQKTRLLTTVPNAAPITIPTAMSTTLPLSRNLLNPESMRFPLRELRQNLRELLLLDVSAYCFMKQ